MKPNLNFALYEGGKRINLIRDLTTSKTESFADSCSNPKRFIFPNGEKYDQVQEFNENSLFQKLLESYQNKFLGN
jgi:hypothetical protein